MTGGTRPPIDRPLRLVARAPVRCADAGGWTDTWFATAGSVCNVAVAPGAEVVLDARPAVDGGAGIVRLRCEAYGDDYCFHGEAAPGRHPLLEAAIRRWAPAQSDLDIQVRAAIPPGSGLGTSAAVAVALVGALEHATDGRVDPLQVAHAAHALETDDLGLQSGVQDQYAAALGGPLLLRVSPYPRTEAIRLVVSDAVIAALDAQFVTVSLGRPHHSSAVHEHVISRFVHEPRAADEALEPLREAAEDAAAALVAEDLPAYGHALASCTRAQEALHPELVCPDAHSIIAVARAEGALGWKVNGAGGDGGTVTVLAAPGGAARLRDTLRHHWSVLPLTVVRTGLSIDVLSD